MLLGHGWLVPFFVETEVSISVTFITEQPAELTEIDPKACCCHSLQHKLLSGDFVSKNNEPDDNEWVHHVDCMAVFC